MRLRRKTLWGRIDKNGTPNVHWNELEDFCKLHPNKAIIVRVEVQATEPSEKLKNYWFGYVVKEMQRAFYDLGYNYSEARTYDEIRKNCPLFLEEKRENGEWKTRVKEWEELDVAEAVDIIAWTQRWASEEFFWIIDDPR